MYKQIKPLQGVVLSNVVQRIQDNAFIPFDPANTDYQAYLKWLDAGNAPLGADTPEAADAAPAQEG
jgi:hypothetical protein